MPTLVPQIGLGLRLSIEVTQEDFDAVLALPRKKGKELRITALDGERYLLVTWPCSLGKHCCCDLLAYGLVDE